MEELMDKLESWWMTLKAARRVRDYDETQNEPLFDGRDIKNVLFS